MPFITTAPSARKSTTPAYSTPYPNVPEAAMTGLARTRPPPTSTRRSTCATIESQLHQQRILTVRVVPRSKASFPEAEPAVQRDRRGIVATDLEQRGPRTTLRPFRERVFHEPTPDRAAPPIGVNRDVLDLEHSCREPTTKVTHHGTTGLAGETRQHDPREGESKLAQKNVGRPWVRKRPALEFAHDREIAQHHDVEHEVEWPSSGSPGNRDAHQRISADAQVNPAPKAARQISAPGSTLPCSIAS
jgi:hypothetical protein